MNVVKRAIIMAAGKGTRLKHITHDIPKPLVKVNGKRMIDYVIEALRENDINEIYVVVGYLKEKFNFLKEYSGVTLIENPYFDDCNNISSLYVAKDYIENSIILDGDQIIYDSSILSKYFEYSGYNVIWTDEQTNEWILELEDGFIKSCNKEGGKSGWQLFSVSRWSDEDGKKLKKHLEIEFINKKNTNIYWDEVALFCYPNEYKLSVKEMKKGDILEIDSIEDLISIDKSYFGVV